MGEALCPECGPGYRYGDDGCRHTPPPVSNLIGYPLPMTPAVPDPTVEALREHLWADRPSQTCGCGWQADSAWMTDRDAPNRVEQQHLAHVAAALTARAAAPDALRVRVEALAAEFGECWVTRSEVRCTGFIGGTFNNGGEWVEVMCCLPCRLAALLEDGGQ